MNAFDDCLRAICLEHGVFLTREALALGLHDKAIRALVRSGSWVRVRHGAYTLRDIWDSSGPVARHQLRSRAAYRTANTDVVLSHTSSLAVHGTPFWGLPLDDVHLTRLDGRAGRHAAGLVQHCGRVTDADIEFDGELRYMSGTRTALEITMMTDLERSLVVVHGLLRAGKTTAEQLRCRYVDMEMWPRTLTTDLMLRLCDDRIESVAETRTFFLLYRAGLPRPVPQFEVRDHRGRVVARLDFAWPDLGVWIEVDGRAKYDELRRVGETAVDVLMREKRREERVRELTGWECIRITWADLAHPERIVARIRAAVARQSRRRPL